MEQRACSSDPVETDSGLRRNDANTRATDAEAGVLRGPVDAPPRRTSQSSAAGPAMVGVVRPLSGSLISRASFARDRSQRVFPSSSRTGDDNATRAWRAAAASAAAWTRGCCKRNGSSTFAALRSSAPSSMTIMRAAAARSRTRPARALESDLQPVTHDRGVRGARPRLGDQVELVVQRAFKTVIGGVTSAPKTCTSRRGSRGSAETVSWRWAASTAAFQSGSTPSSLTDRVARAAARNTTGVFATFGALLSRARAPLLACRRRRRRRSSRHSRSSSASRRIQSRARPPPRRSRAAERGGGGARH